MKITILIAFETNHQVKATLYLEIHFIEMIMNAREVDRLIVTIISNKIALIIMIIVVQTLRIETTTVADLQVVQTLYPVFINRHIRVTTRYKTISQRNKLQKTLINNREMLMQETRSLTKDISLDLVNHLNLVFIVAYGIGLDIALIL